MKKKIVIIGSGFGGLATAARLAASGHDVEIFEKRDKLGGRAYTYEINGFKFDGGPSVVTAPWLFDEIWALAGKRREDYFTLIPVDPFYRIFDHTGRSFSYNNDHAFILDQIRQWNPADVDGYDRFMATTREIFMTGMNILDRPFLHISDMFKAAPDLIRLGSYRSVYNYVSRFIDDEFLRRCFSFHPLLIGGNPFDAASLYVLIHYLEREWGVHYALGGTGAIVNAFGKLLGELNVKVHTDCDVREILVENKRARGVRLSDGTRVAADLVVSNADVAWTYLNLLPPETRSVNTDRRIKNYKYSMSLFVIYFGTKKRYNNTKLAHHNIILSERYRGLLNDIFNETILPPDFSLYLHVPTLTDPGMAPEGHEAFYVIAPVPHMGSGIDWTKQAKPHRDSIMQFLENNYLPDLQENIVAEHYIDPLHFQETLNSYLGSAFSVQSTILQSAWFRPHNRSEDFENLYFVGAGTHPGAGLPGVLTSARIVGGLVGGA